MKGSSFVQRLQNLSQEIGGEIIIHEDSATAETESLIRKVATGEIRYTVTDQTIAMVNSLYYPNLDIGTVMSLSQQISWGVRKNSPELLKAVNAWLGQIKKNAIFQVIFNKYFDSPRFSLVPRGMQKQVFGHVLVTRILHAPLDFEALRYRSDDLLPGAAVGLGQREGHRHG